MNFCRLLVGVFATVAFGCGDNGIEFQKLPPMDQDQAGPTTVTLTSNGQPLENSMVFFSQKNGELIAAIPTDGGGVATATIPPDAQLTVLMPQPAGLLGVTELRTRVGVQPGEHFDFELATPVAENVTYQSVQVNVAGAVEGAVFYNTTSGHSFMTSPDLSYSFYPQSPDLNSDGQYFLYSEALALDDVPLAHALVTGITPQAAPTFGQLEPVVNMPAWSSGATIGTVDFGNAIPAGYDLSEIYVSARRDGRTVRSTYVGQEPATLWQADNVVTDVLSEVTLRSNQAFGNATLKTVVPAPITTLTTDLSAAIPGRIEEVTLDTTERPRVVASFTTTVPASGLDHTQACLFYQSATAGLVTWSFFGPPEVTSFTVPVLPDDLAFAVADATATYGSVQVRQVGSSRVDGWDEARHGFLSPAGVSTRDLEAGDSVLAVGGAWTNASLHPRAGGGGGCSLN